MIRSGSCAKVCVHRAGAGAKEGGKSLLGRDEPSRWYEAAEALPALADAAAAAPADDAAVEAARVRAEAALEREAEILERTMPARVGGADARWLQQVRRSGTTADKVAAHSLIIQVRLKSSAFSPPLLMTNILSWSVCIASVRVTAFVADM